MIVSIAPKALPGAKEQAHRLRDAVATGLIIEKPSKSCFLNKWATCLGYQDWGTFTARTLHAHQGCSNELIITPDTITPLAQALRRALGQGDTDPEWLEAILLNVANEQERVGLIAAGWQPMPIERSNIVELVLGPKTKYQLSLLLWLWPRRYSFKLDDINVRYCQHVKRLRVGLTKKEAIDRSLDVYPKSGVRVSQLVAELIDDGYLENLDDEETAIRITQRGHWWVSTYHTDDWGEEWQAWFQAVQNAYPSDARMPFPDDWSMLINMYSNGNTPIKAADFYAWSPRAKAYGHHLTAHISEQTGIPLNDLPQTRILAVEPRLLLDPFRRGLKLSDISLSITSPDGIDIPKLTLRRYFPNSMHVGAGVSKEFRFFYVPVKEGADKIEVVLAWEAAGHHITHSITYHLGTAERGWLYSDQCSVNSHCHTPFSWLSQYWLRYEIDGDLLEDRVHLPLNQEAVLALPRVASQFEELIMDGHSISMKEHLQLVGGSPNDAR